ncbi:MAG TPA: HU family DNA-binding protein [Spirochaetota bacterium]|nr:HU family DNA-binding protein [Spirochaetota bacterium]HOL57982.1 HU family DNA-binding protein [Spirochaetota bacterium]HPP05331.1 HU family DNA-binding protein [Spirochaetota bacterium]
MTKLEAAILILEKLKREEYNNLLEIIPENEKNVKLKKKENLKSKRISRVVVEKIINLFIEIIKEKMLEGEKIEFRGFGSFERRLRRPKKTQNPKTGEVVNLQSRYIPFFKPSKEFKLLFKNIKEK